MSLGELTGPDHLNHHCGKNRNTKKHVHVVPGRAEKY